MKKPRRCKWYKFSVMITNNSTRNWKRGEKEMFLAMLCASILKAKTLDYKCAKIEEILL